MGKSSVIILLCCALIGCKQFALHNYQGTQAISDSTIQLYQHTPTANRTNIVRILKEDERRILASSDLSYSVYRKLATNHVAGIDYDIADYFVTNYLDFMQYKASVPMNFRQQALANGFEMVLDWFDERYHIYPYKEELIQGKVVIY